MRVTEKTYARQTVSVVDCQLMLPEVSCDLPSSFVRIFQHSEESAMDALAAYGSDDDSDDDNQKTTSTGALLGGYGSDSDDADNSETEKAAQHQQHEMKKSSNSNTTLRKRTAHDNADHDENNMAVHFLPDDNLTSDLFMDNPAGTPDTTSHLARLHKRVKATLSSNPPRHKTPITPEIPPPDYSCYAEFLDKTKSHEFHNPLFMEKLIQELNIQRPLGSNVAAPYDEPVLAWESNLLAMEEQARVRQFQQHPAQGSNHNTGSTTATALAQQQLSRSLAMKNTQGDV